MPYMVMGSKYEIRNNFLAVLMTSDNDPTPTSTGTLQFSNTAIWRGADVLIGKIKQFSVELEQHQCQR